MTGASVEKLLRLDVRIAARGAWGWNYRHTMRTDLRGGLGQTGVDVGRRLYDPARAVELMAEGAA